MDWNPKNWKFDWRNWKNSKECWLLLLAAGLILLVLAFPAGKKEESRLIRSSGQAEGQTIQAEEQTIQAEETPVPAYEQQIEKRLEDILEQTEGVGKVKVMVVLKSSEAKVWHTDQNSSFSRTQETDSQGGSRSVESQESSHETVITEQSGPLLEKEIRPEISGVIVSASGGGSPQVQAEIAAAVEALLDLPAHRIKVLKMKD